MEQEKEKYSRLIALLRKSKPVPDNSSLLAEKVMARIQMDRTTLSASDLFYGFIFGWVDVGWLRKSMVTAAVSLLLFFAYQQTVILRRLDALSGRTVVDISATRTTMAGELPGKLKMYSLFGKRSNPVKMNVTEKDIDKFIETVNDLQVRYENIYRIIEGDPELKEYFEEKIKKSENSKPKI